MKKREAIPRERSETVRQELKRLLENKELSVGELSKTVRKSEKEVYDHLRHLQEAGVLKITAAACGGCGYAFDRRAKVTKPGKCPKCKGTFIKEPLFFVRTK
jgi:hypothetical protein